MHGLFERVWAYIRLDVARDGGSRDTANDAAPAGAAAAAVDDDDAAAAVGGRRGDDGGGGNGAAIRATVAAAAPSRGLLRSAGVDDDDGSEAAAANDTSGAQSRYSAAAGFDWTWPQDTSMFVCEGHDFHDALPFSGRDFGSHYAAEVPLIRHSIPLLQFTLNLTFHSKLTLHFINESSFAK